MSICKFLINGRKNKTYAGSSYAGGLHIQFSRYTFTTLIIKNCAFNQNTAPPLDALDPKETMNFTQWSGNGLGGGIGLLLLKYSSCVTVYILNCTFKSNKAPWGGGLCAYLQAQISNNNVMIANSTFMGNSARNGGDGVQV